MKSLSDTMICWKPDITNPSPTRNDEKPKLAKPKRGFFAMLEGKDKKVAVVIVVHLVPKGNKKVIVQGLSLLIEHDKYISTS